MDNSGADVCELERFTYAQARQYIDERPAIIVPLGGCEPFGGVGALGVESYCAEGIAKELSLRCDVLTVPVIPFGCSTPFIGFAGAAGLKPRTFVNMLCDILHAYIFQGVKKIFLVNAAPFSREPAAEAAKRLMSAHPRVTVLLFDINTILRGDVKGGGGDSGAINVKPSSKSHINNRDNTGFCFDRDDALLLSIYAYLRQENFEGIDQVVKKNIREEQYRTWKKRGADPQKLRKLFPDGLLLPPDFDINSAINSERGGENFLRIVELLQKEIDNIL
jgi:hypothetical protein